MFLDLKKASQDIPDLSKKYGLAVDPNAKVEDISVGAQQRVEILKTLYRGADIPIFDEPTAVLTPAEIEELMTIMKNLANEGKSIILITHKLDEIRAVSDRVTVIRRGKSIETVEIGGATNQDLARNDGRPFCFPLRLKRSFSTERSGLVDRKLGCKRKPWCPSC